MKRGQQHKQCQGAWSRPMQMPSCAEPPMATQVTTANAATPMDSRRPRPTAAATTGSVRRVGHAAAARPGSRAASGVPASESTRLDAGISLAGFDPTEGKTFSSTYARPSATIITARNTRIGAVSLRPWITFAPSVLAAEMTCTAIRFDLGTWTGWSTARDKPKRRGRSLCDAHGLFGVVPVPSNPTNGNSCWPPVAPSVTGVAR